MLIVLTWLYSAMFAVTGVLVLTVLGHARGAFDFLALGCIAGGIAICLRLIKTRCREEISIVLIVAASMLLVPPGIVSAQVLRALLQQPPVRAGEEPTIWGVALAGEFRPAFKRLVVPVALVPGAQTAESMKDAVAHKYFDNEEQRKVAAELLADLLEGSQPGQQIPASAVSPPDAAIPLEAVTDQLRLGWHVRGKDPDWLRLLRQSEGFYEVMWLSAVARRGNFALVYMETGCDGHCGRTEMVLLEKDASGWVIRRMILVTVA
jgi:hypothetical protein